jgi:uncharacterized membrane protein HdeD (DUF308 family)
MKNNNISNVLLGLFIVFAGIVTYFNPQLIVNKFNQPIEFASYYAVTFIFIGVIITVIFYKKLDNEK